MMKRTLMMLMILLICMGCAGEPVQKEMLEQEEPIITEAPQEVETMSKKVLMIIAPDGFRDEEYLEPKEVFEKAGLEVTTASKGVSAAKGKLGATADVDVDISDVEVSAYDAVVFVGGPGATVYFDDADALRIAKEVYGAGKVTAAICIAPSILANAGVLEGHKATCFESESSNVDAKSAGYTGEPVTVDGKIVTGNGPGAATAFGKEIVKLLE